MKAKKREDLTWDENVVIWEAEHESRVKKAMHKKNKNWDEMTDEEAEALPSEELIRMQTGELIYKVEKWKHIFIGSILFDLTLFYYLFFGNLIIPTYIVVCIAIALIISVYFTIRFYYKWDFAKVEYRFLLAFYKYNGIE
jgi:hypothetical protein